MADPDPSNLAEPESAWPPRPRALTTRGVLLVIAVLVFAVAMAAASVYMRRTRLDKTTAFWGPKAIAALQYGNTLRLVIPANSPLIESPSSESPSSESPSSEAQAVEQVTDLSGTPGLGHFRHALLDERHYDWTTEQPTDISEVDVEEPEYVTIELDGPPANIEPATLRLELSQGWTGAPGSGRSVQLTPRVRTAVRHFLVTLKDMHASPTP